jgi:hypothetical protein
MEFNAILEKFDSELWTYHVKVPYVIARQFIDSTGQRVIASLNNGEGIHCAIMAAGDDVYFLNMNAEIRKKYQLSIGSTVHIALKPDTSKYGMPMPEELEAVLEEDDVFNTYFDALTPGKQRNLIYIVNKVKDSDKRIRKSIVIADHLKNFSGKIDFKVLNAALRGR